MTQSISMKNIDKIQTEAVDAWFNTPTFNGLLTMATGTGKTKVAISVLKKLKGRKRDFKFLVIVPRTSLRDDEWPDQFSKWGTNIELNTSNIECYASIAKIKDQEYDLVIFDECHNLTPANEVFLSQNKIKNKVAITATYPEDKEKDLILKKHFVHCFDYNLNEAVDQEVVSPFTLQIITIPLDDRRNIVAGGKKKFLTSEVKNYEYLSKQINIAIFQKHREERIKFLRLNRTRFIYNLPSKTRKAQEILNSLDKNKKILIFAGSIEQANILCEHRYHSKTNDIDLNRFKSDDIKVLSSVASLNEGHNIQNLDTLLIVQATSSSLQLIQRIGRAIRFREGHVAEVIVLLAEGTQDEKWFKNASKDLNVDIEWT